MAILNTNKGSKMATLYTPDQLLDMTEIEAIEAEWDAEEEEYNETHARYTNFDEMLQVTEDDELDAEFEREWKLANRPMGNCY